MPQVSKNSRDQLQMIAIEEHVPEDSIVRLIDTFIQGTNLEELGFLVKGKSREGRPAFPPETLSKLYLYGYLHGIRSSRKLEHACKINVELWWLLQFQKPRYKTIAEFRRVNTIGFANLFAHFRNLCLQQGLYGKKTIAIDGSKFRAQNSKKNNYNDRKINKHLDYIDNQYQDYLNDLDDNDKVEGNDKIKQKLKDRRSKYEDLKDQLSQTNETQISTSDPDARALPLHMRIVEVGYNLQSVVDDKHNLIVDYQVTNKNDHRALAPMALRSRAALQLEEKDKLTVLADKGYHTGEQMQTCHDSNIDTLVAAPRKPKQTDVSKPVNLRKENFKYNKRSDTYTCPNGKKLTKQARYKRRNKRGQSSGEFDRYAIKFSICKHCPHLDQCVSKSNRKTHQGRYLDRYLTDRAVAKNKSNLSNNRKLYKRRQAIVEHPFDEKVFHAKHDGGLGDRQAIEPRQRMGGKRQWGYSYTLLKTIPKVQTEFSIIMLSYNLKRAMSILGANQLQKALKCLFFDLFNLTTHIGHVIRKDYNLICRASQCFSLH